MTRNGTVEIMRLLGAFGILWYHVHAPGREVGFVALPMFVAFLVLLQPRGQGLQDLIARRSRRLLWPWLLWSLVFLAAEAWLRRRLPELPGDWGPWIVGPAIHLWFLPFAFFCGLVVHVTDRLLPASFLVAGLLFALGWAIFMIPQSPSVPWPQWGRGGAILVVSLALRHLPALSRQASLAVPAGLILAGVACLALGGLDPGTLLLGVALAQLARLVFLPAPPWMASFGALAMLVYLVHPLVFLAVGKFTGFEATLILAMLTLAGALAFSLGVVRLRVQGLLI